MGLQSYEQTYRPIQQLAGPFTEQVRAAARASHNEAEFRSRITRHIEDVAARLGVAAAELWGLSGEELAEFGGVAGGEAVEPLRY